MQHDKVDVDTMLRDTEVGSAQADHLEDIARNAGQRGLHFVDAPSLDQTHDVFQDDTLGLECVDGADAMRECLGGFVLASARIIATQTVLLHMCWHHIDVAVRAEAIVLPPTTFAFVAERRARKASHVQVQVCSLSGKCDLCAIQSLGADRLVGKSPVNQVGKEELGLDARMQGQPLPTGGSDVALEDDL